MKPKISYKVQNWSIYNRALVARGNITLWIDEAAIKNWYAGMRITRGRPFTYSDLCIELGLTLRSLFCFPLRSTQGYLQGLMKLMGLDLKVPHYSSLSRRAGKLNIDFRVSKKKDNASVVHDIVIDSTGLKIYGEGEWKMRTHGKDKRRTWRKLHLAADPESFQVVAMVLSTTKNTDDQMVPALLGEEKNVRNVYGDGAYISKSCFDAIVKSGGRAKIPIRSGTTTVDKNPSPGQQERNRLVKEMWKAGGKSDWKKISGYHKRSLVETQMFRFKTILGDKLANREFENQITEAKIKIKILNRMTTLGMPISIKSM